MTISRGKTVALIDPLWVGHHPMYFSQFTASFLRCGARVIGLCPDPESALENLKQAVDEQTAANLHNLVHVTKLPTGKRSFFNGRFEGDPARTFGRWRRAAETLTEAESACGRHADLVYFPYLDSYLRFLPFPMVADAILRRPWSGLYLRNHHHGESRSPMRSLRMLAKGDAIFRSRHCRAVGVLDERFIPAMEEFTRKPIVAYPDVTQGGLPPEPFPLVHEIREKAAGRKIVGVIGLERRKGFLTLIRTAELARREHLPFYFVSAGAFPPGEYTDDERAEIEAVVHGISSGLIDNLHFDPAAGRIRDETDFNALFSSFDIAWAAYEGFQGSSGTLSKAALFEIPCIGTAGECIGQRIERYRMGLTIPEATPSEALAALPSIAAGTDREGRAMNPNYSDYRDNHSQDRLDRILGDLLETLS